MQFFKIALSTMAAILVPFALACNQGQDCCFGGEDGGWKGCMNQHNNLLIEDRASRCDDLKPDYCSNNGVSEAQCGSDCCSISRKVGIACP
ncbi:hypothetical protein BKA61DRAFT_683813 [Leptodontidium sp. MPI-SDFR-AT-0119]|nr:hypothetical protein BKA61DRAFT_683813 [Leptodontidium sp. MPI-SDFR-AT-0119]